MFCPPSVRMILHVSFLIRLIKEADNKQFSYINFSGIYRPTMHKNIYIYIYIYIGNVYFVRFPRHTICFKQLAPQVARATKTRMLADERITDITWLCRRFAISVLEISYTFVFYHELKLLGFIIASIGAFMKHQELLYGLKRPLWLCKHSSDR